MNKDCGILVNSSREVIYPDDGVYFAEKSRKPQNKYNTNGYSSFRKRI